VQTNGERIQIEQNDIKNLEAIEKQEILVTKQVRLRSKFKFTPHRNLPMTNKYFRLEAF
jgi:hypothetical protein